MMSSPGPTPLISSRRFVIGALLFTLYLVFGISWLAYAPLMEDLTAAYDITRAQGGTLISWVSLAKAFVPLFAGALAARLGLKKAVAVGAAFSALAVVLPLLSNYTALLVGRFLFGVGGAIIVTLMGPVVMTWFPKNELPIITGLNNVAVNTGITIAIFATVPVSLTLGWRPTLIVFGGLCTALAVLWMLFGATGPLQRPAPGAEPNSGGPTGPKTSNETSGEIASEARPTIGEMMRHPVTWWVAVAFTGPLSLYLALNTWLPAHLEAAYGLDRVAASGLTSLFNFVGIPVAVLSGVLCSKLGRRRPLIILAGLLMPLSSLALIGSAVPGVRVAGAVVLGASLFLYVAPLFTIPMELPELDAPRVALMMGCIFSLAYIVSTVSPWLTGYLADQYGTYSYGLTLFCATSSLLAVGGFMLPETGPGAAPQPPQPGSQGAE